MSAIVSSITPPLKTPDVASENTIATNNDAIDILAIAKRALDSVAHTINNFSKKTATFTGTALASGASIITNSILTATVGLTHLTGFLIFPAYVIRSLTKPLHKANLYLAKHSITPLNKWAETLYNDVQRLESEKVIWNEGGRILFSPKNYKNRVRDTLKSLVSPVVVALGVVSATLWLAAKPLYFALVLPGALADALVMAPIALNKALGSLTYSPLEQLTNEMFAFHLKLLKDVGEGLDAMCCAED
ncbi:MAG: hypothetical protein H0X29_10820 [Parachlamydiaceae bacterium]|nr:hypothetical protein [Parachlamydiaceae bacterium]